jgi:hypothetical protein
MVITSGTTPPGGLPRHGERSEHRGSDAGDRYADAVRDILAGLTGDPPAAHDVRRAHVVVLWLPFLGLSTGPVTAQAP